MARKPKVDNSLLKRLQRREENRRENLRSTRQFFLIVCEGARTEPFYFKGFKNALPSGVLEANMIEIQGEGKNTLTLVHETQKIRAKRERSTGRTFDQTWVVFDRDSFPPSNFDNAICKAGSADPEIKCAWTNEAFELWYCLHFNFISHSMPREDYKKQIEAALTGAMGREFKYQKNDPGMFSILQKYGDQAQAILRAEKMAREFGGRTDYSAHNPCTQVHKLVSALNALAGG